MDNLVVGQGQDIVLREGVHQGEGDVPVVELAEVGVQLDVVADIVHPAMFHLKLKPRPPSLTGWVTLGQAVDSSGDHENVGVGGEIAVVQLLEELDGLQVLLPAVDVGHPGTVPAAVVQVEHGGHRVHPQAVGVVLLQPEHGVGEQERAHLVAAKSKTWVPQSGCSPLRASEYS